MSQSSVGELYRSLPLPSASKCIRVLDIDPGSTSTATIVGNLRIVDLTTCPKFTALSYVWSSSKPYRTIACNDVNIAISANAHSALQHLRTNLGAFTIWIDGTCIDQANEKEKEHQIPLMKDIYSQAATVYVWLGEGNDSNDRTISYLKTAGFLDYYHAGASNNRVGFWRPFLAALSAAMARYSLRRHPFPFQGVFSENTSLFTLTRKAAPGTLYGPLGPMIARIWEGNVNYATIADIEYLLDRKWIKRLWTYQEIFFAVNVVVVCGNAHICWNRFAMSLIFLETAIPYLGLCVRPWKRVVLSRQQYMDTESASPRLARSSSLEMYTEFSKRVCSFHFFMLMAMLAFFALLSSLMLFCTLALGIIPHDYELQGTAAPDNLFQRYLLSTSPMARKAICAVLSIITLITFMKYVRIRTHTHLGHCDREYQVTVNDLIDSIYTREATRSKDMAFGLWAILQLRTQLALPEVDYEESKETIYLAFSRAHVQTTASPTLLLVAAMNNMKEQPSWVPDWTPKRHRDCDWGDIEELIRQNLGADELKRKQMDTVSISMVDQHAVSVWGRRHGVVVATFVFQKTQSSYQQEEFHKHVYNLGRMIKICGALGIFWGGFRKIGLETVATDRCNRWSWFLLHNYRSEASALLGLLRNTPCHMSSEYSATERSEILETHITVCNILARDRKILFQGLCPGSHITPIMSWCRRSVKDGDLILRCPGVQIPLIVRPYPDVGNRVQIKGIAHTPDLFDHELLFGCPYRESQFDARNTTELEEFHVH